MGVLPQAKQVQAEYDNLIENLGNEFYILLDAPRPNLERVTLPRVAEGIIKVREGDVKIEAGYDGVFGKISIFGKNDNKTLIRQKTLF